MPRRGRRAGFAESAHASRGPGSPGGCGGKKMKRTTRAAALLLLWLFLFAAAGVFSAGADAGAASGDKKPDAAERQDWTDRIKQFQASLADSENGRFHAVRLDGTSVFVIDTRQGHLWVWTFGEKGSFTAYQGRVFPGLKMGDIIDASGPRRQETQ